MERINIKRKDLISISAYLRHVELSLHRRENDNDLKFKNYFTNSSNKINKVLQYEKVKYSFLNTYVNKNFINQSELDIATYLLDDFCRYIENLNYDEKKIMYLRINIGHIQRILSSRLPNKVRKDINQIEHYNQNQILKTISLNEFL
ncbi:hypothetical protein [uncultured Aquimarina sp.]|uniref:hypothetical protein n=1 Tax=uncultured Aquimarina sp. TaxID=575652 RepID=UPI002602C8BC|nr:hypothetical protein [uncultured Aquimarina sp.]